MLDYIKGLIKSVNLDGLVVDIGNIGLRVGVFNPDSFKPGQMVELYSYMHWNQENGPSLFGFSTQLEKDVFLLIISCSGIGPKIGLAVLKDLGVSLFLDAISQENDKILSKVSGIGAKKAEQIVVSLKYKVAKLIESGVIVDQLGSSSEASKLYEVSDVLKSLNYSKPEISAAINYLGKNCSGVEYSFDQLIRQALSFLSSKGALAG